MCGQASELLIEPIMVGKVPICAVGLQGKYIQELRVVRTGEKFEIVPFLHWLDPRFPQDPALRDSTEAVLDRINESSRRDIAQDTTPPPPIAPFVGAEACAACHEREVEIWRRSARARSRDARRPGSATTMICVGCHVTGFLAAEGREPARHSPARRGSVRGCHGQAQAHIADPSVPYPKRSDDIAVMDVCIQLPPGSRTRSSTGTCAGPSWRADLTLKPRSSTSCGKARPQGSTGGASIGGESLRLPASPPSQRFADVPIGSGGGPQRGQHSDCQSGRIRVDSC